MRTFGVTLQTSSCHQSAEESARADLGCNGHRAAPAPSENPTRGRFPWQLAVNRRKERFAAAMQFSPIQFANRVARQGIYQHPFIRQLERRDLLGSPGRHRVGIQGVSLLSLHESHHALTVFAGRVPTTAVSAISGCSSRTLSTSPGAIFEPRLTMISLSRPTNQILASSSIRPSSPECSQPSRIV